MPRSPGGAGHHHPVVLACLLADSCCATQLIYQGFVEEDDLVHQVLDLVVEPGFIRRHADREIPF